MKSDISRLMSEASLDAAVVVGSSAHNPAMYYLTNGAHVGRAIVVQRRGEEPVLIHLSMERDEAAKSGLRLIDESKYDLFALEREEGDPLRAAVRYYGRIFDELGVRGRVGFYGTADLGAGFALLSALRASIPGIEVVGEYQHNIYEQARLTKDVTEIERMRQVGRLTVEVVDHTLQFLRQHAVQNETLMRADGQPLTVADVKREIRRSLFERGLSDDEGLIFAIGHDAGVPHSSGEAGDPIVLGRTIVFDIFPQEAGGGYFTDMTRTFCLGYAPPQAQALYDQVMYCFEQVRDKIRVGERCGDYQALTCDIFEELGHPTIRQDRSIQQGYVHSLAHGIGLKVHEEPWFKDAPTNTTRLAPGQVFTLEPGLYYPDKNLGIRVEDTVWINEQGQLETLTEYPRELVIEMET